MPGVRRQAIISVAVAAALTIVGSAAAGAADRQIDTTSRASVIDSYRSWLEPTLDVPVGWTGSVESCRVGTSTVADRRATLAAVNYMRAMARLPAVVLRAEFNSMARAAALITDANGYVDHSPPRAATCWTRAGFNGASQSNLALAYGFETVDGQEPRTAATGARAIVSYMLDPGRTNDIVGHRRWILYQQLRRIGTGSTTRANALYVVDRPFGRRGTFWVPWPTAGFFPREIEPQGRWSLSYPGAKFANATVEVSTPHGVVPVTTAANVTGYADNTIAWDMTLPPEYSAASDDYAVTVTVSGIGMPGGGVVSHRWTTVLVRAAT